MLKKLITKLYLKYGQPDMVALTREQLQGTRPVMIPSELPLDEQKAVAADARTVLNSVAYQMAHNNVTARLLYHIQTQAPDLTAIMYDRYSINGAALIREELEEMAENPENPDDTFNPHDLI